VQEYHLRLKRPTPNASRRCPPFNPRPRSALLLLRPLSVVRFASLSAKKYGTPYFSARKRTSKYPEAAPKASPSFSVSEKLARYGSSALSGVEYLTLLVGKESIALALIRHFGSLKALARASFQELRQFLPQRKAEAVAAALSMFAIAETEHARSEQLDNPESIYRACTDMKLFNQEVLRVFFLDTRYRHSSTVEITKGSINESLAHPRDIFRPVIGQSAYAFVLVHNL
jgi:DNA repair protein RadC